MGQSVPSCQETPSPFTPGGHLLTSRQRQSRTVQSKPPSLRAGTGRRRSVNLDGAAPSIWMAPLRQSGWRRSVNLGFYKKNSPNFAICTLISHSIEDPTLNFCMSALPFSPVSSLPHINISCFRVKTTRLRFRCYVGAFPGNRPNTCTQYVALIVRNKHRATKTVQIHESCNFYAFVNSW
jgi:hypothetical protein